MTDLAAIRAAHEYDARMSIINRAAGEQAHVHRGALLDLVDACQREHVKPDTYRFALKQAVEAQAALDRLTAEHAALTEAHARQEWTIRTYHAERERLDAVTVEEVAREAGVDPEQAAAVLALIRARVASPEPPPHEEPPCEHRKARTTPCAACLLSARVAGS